MTSRPLLYAFAAVVTLCAAAAPARAEDAKKKAEDLNRAAMEDYDLLEFENARRQLNEALQVLRKAKLDKDKVAAKTHVNLGIVLGGGLGDAGAAIGAFKLALEIDPGAKIDPAYRSAELNAMLDEAKAGAGGGAGGGGAGAGGEPPGGSELVEHTPVEEAKAGKPITITVKVSADAKARQVVLLVRPGGADGYGELTMAGSGGTGGTYKAQIPADAVRGDAIHYYIEVRGAGGKVLASVGTSESPNIVSLGGGGGGAGDAENPFGGGGDGDGGDDGGDDGDRSKGGPSFYLALTAGTGGGYVSGSTEKAGTSVSGCPNCFAPELFHLKPELGFWISARTSIAVIVRIGMPIGANVEGAATIAPAVLVKLSRVLSKDLSWHADVGGGFMRQTIKLEDMPGPNVDTHATGPLLVGGGLTWSKPLTASTKMLIDGSAIMGLPIVKEIGTARPNFGLSIDLSLGVAMAF